MAKEILNDPLLLDVPEVGGFKVLDSCILYVRVGRGGMGAVYRGRHLKLDIDVAVKCLLPRLAAGNEEMVLRFQREGRLAARVNHPNVVRVYDVDCQYGVHYLVMEYVEGETARERVTRKGGALRPGEAVAIVLEAARGMAAAHAQRIVHRDIKPDNILISGRGDVKLADLGLGCIRAGAPGRETLTVSGMALGTPGYMPPEQWNGLMKVGPPGDVWALGATLYFLLAGKDAYVGRELTEIMRRVCLEPFPSIARKIPDLPPDLVQIIRKCTEKDPENRFLDAGELVETLEDVAREYGLKGRLADRQTGSGTARCQVVSPPPPEVIARVRRRLDQERGSGTGKRAGRPAGTADRPAAGGRKLAPVAVTSPFPAPAEAKMAARAKPRRSWRRRFLTGLAAVLLAAIAIFLVLDAWQSRPGEARNGGAAPRGRAAAAAMDREPRLPAGRADPGENPIAPGEPPEFAPEPEPDSTPPDPTPAESRVEPPIEKPAEPPIEPPIEPPPDAQSEVKADVKTDVKTDAQSGRPPGAPAPLEPRSSVAAVPPPEPATSEPEPGSPPPPPPSLAIESPPEGAWVRPPCEFTGSVEPGEDVQVRAGGMAAVVGGGRWRAVLPLPDGEQEVIVEAERGTSAAGAAAARARRMVRVDGRAPAVEILDPVDGGTFWTWDGVVSVWVKVVEEGELAEVSIGGAAATSSGRKGVFTRSVPLTEGRRRIEITASDRAGNRGSAEVEVACDRTPPQLAIMEPGATARAGKLAVRGRVEDSSPCAVLVNGRPARVGEDGRWELEVDLAAGIRRLTIAARDRAGNDAEALERAVRVIPAGIENRVVPGFTPIGQNEQGYPEYRHDATGIVMVLLPGDAFLMGSSAEEQERAARAIEATVADPGAREFLKAVVRAEGPRRQIALDPFLIAKHEVSQRIWTQVMGDNPSRIKGDRLPVESVTWVECKDFCRQTGLALPAEAQWEYACRAGTETPFSFGDAAGTEQANFNGGRPFSGGPGGVHRGRPVAVDALPPNDFGLQNLHGNVAEWCEDAFDAGFYARPQSTLRNPVCFPPSVLSPRSVRGGSWALSDWYCRSASRESAPPDRRSYQRGFRPAFYPIP